MAFRTSKYLFNLSAKLAAAAGLIGAIICGVTNSHAAVTYALDEGGGSVAIDGSGNSNDGVLIGSPQFSGDTPDNSPYSLNFDRIDDRIDAGFIDAATSALTLAAWIRAESFPGSARDPHLISKTSGNALGDHIFMLSTVKAGSGIRLRGRLRTNGTTVQLRAGPGFDLVEDTWYHVAMTYDGQRLKLYLDGQEIADRTLTGFIDQDSTVPLSIGGKSNGGNLFHGQMDDVRILDQALSAAEIVDIVSGAGTNSAPTPNPDNFTAIEDSVLSVDLQSGVLSNDSDAENDALIAELVSGPENGQVVLSLDGAFSYTPDQDFNGLDSYIYKAFDGSSYSVETVVTVLVSSVNDNPVGNDDTYDTQLDTTFLGNVIDNDSDVDRDSLQAVLISDVQNGDLTLQSDGSFSYHPEAGFIGTDTFTYRATDSSGGISQLTTATIRVSQSSTSLLPGAIVTLLFEEGTGPLALDNSGQGNNGFIVGNPVYTNSTSNGSDFALQMDGAGDAVDLGGLDVNGSALTLAAWFNADRFSGSANDPRLISKANGNAANSHVFMLSTIKSGTGIRLRGRLRVGGSTRTLRADPGHELSTDRWYHAAFTYDGESMRLYLDGELIGTQALSGAIDQDPALGVWVGSQPGGSHAFDGALDDVIILDSSLDAGQIVELMNGVEPTDLPIAINDSYIATEDQELLVDQASGVLINDTHNGDGMLTADLVAPPVHGSVQLSADGSFSYTPDADFNGEDSFSYQSVSSQGRSQSATVIVTVTSENDVPVAVDDVFSTEFETALTDNLLTNDFDIDGDDITATLLMGPQQGLVMVALNGDFQYTPAADFSGQEQFTYSITDGNSPPAQATVTVTVHSDSTPPENPDGVVHLPFDEGAGTLAFDVSGQENHGVLVGDTTFDTETADGSSHSIRLNGAGDGVDLGFVDVAGSQLTMAAWIKADSFPGNARDPRIISKASGNASSAHVFMLSTVAAASETRLRARLKVNGSTRTLRAVAGNSLQPGEWYHVAATYDGQTLRLYLNAQEVGSRNFSGIIDQNPGIGVRVGGQPTGSNGFVGLIDDARIIGRAMTQSELQNIFNAIPPGNVPPTARNDSYFVDADTELVVTTPAGVLSNDTDPDSPDLTMQLLVGPSHGVLNEQPDGSFNYLPDAGFSGIDLFTYRASDGDSFSNVASVVINIDGGPQDEPPRFVSGGVSFEKQVIDTAVEQTHYAGGADLDGDVDIDIIATDYVSGAVYYYVNNGDGTFTKTILDASLPGSYPAHLSDIDGDLDIDVLAGGYLSDTVALYENDGSGNFTKQIIDTSAEGIHSVVDVDLDQDGLVDLLTADQDAGDIAWYEKDANGNYTRHVIDANTSKAKRADFADFNGDGALDVVAASDGVNRIAWYENDGAQNFTRRVIDSNLTAAYYVLPVDINADGSIDILAAGKLANRIVIYRNDGSGDFTRQVIDTNARGARSVDAADIDGDGDLDALGNSLQGDTVSWYENTGLNTYTEHVISTGIDSAPYSVIAVDMDLDGQPDVLVAARDDDSVSIYFNVRLHQENVVQGGTILLGTVQLEAIDEDSPVNEIHYRLESEPDQGELLLNGTVLTVGDRFTQDDVNQNRLGYSHFGLSTIADSLEVSVGNDALFSQPGARARIEIAITN